MQMIDTDVEKEIGKRVFEEKRKTDKLTNTYTQTNKHAHTQTNKHTQTQTHTNTNAYIGH